MVFYEKLGYLGHNSKNCTHDFSQDTIILRIQQKHSVDSSPCITQNIKKIYTPESRFNKITNFYYFIKGSLK